MQDDPRYFLPQGPSNPKGLEPEYLPPVDEDFVLNIQSSARAKRLADTDPKLYQQMPSTLVQTADVAQAWMFSRGLDPTNPQSAAIAARQMAQFTNLPTDERKKLRQQMESLAVAAQGTIPRQSGYVEGLQREQQQRFNEPKYSPLEQNLQAFTRGILGEDVTNTMEKEGLVRGALEHPIPQGLLEMTARLTNLFQGDRPTTTATSLAEDIARPFPVARPELTPETPRPIGSLVGELGGFVVPGAVLSGIAKKGITKAVPKLLDIARKNPKLGGALIGAVAEGLGYGGAAVMRPGDKSVGTETFLGALGGGAGGALRAVKLFDALDATRAGRTVKEALLGAGENALPLLAEPETAKLIQEGKYKEAGERIAVGMAMAGGLGAAVGAASRGGEAPRIEEPAVRAEPKQGSLLPEEPKIKPEPEPPRGPEPQPIEPRPQPKPEPQPPIEPQPIERPQPEQPRSPEVPEGLSPEAKDFHGKVWKAVTESPTWAGGDKVFISDVWDRFHAAHPDVPREEFNRQLIEANRNGSLQLTRADLVQAMDPEKVRNSEIRHLNAEFHFIRKKPLERPQRPARSETAFAKATGSEEAKAIEPEAFHQPDPDEAQVLKAMTAEERAAKRRGNIYFQDEAGGIRPERKGFWTPRKPAPGEKPRYVPAPVELIGQMEGIIEKGTSSLMKRAMKALQDIQAPRTRFAVGFKPRPTEKDLHGVLGFARVGEGLVRMHHASQAETAAHEFGHIMHAMVLGDFRLVNLGGGGSPIIRTPYAKPVVYSEIEGMWKSLSPEGLKEITKLGKELYPVPPHNGWISEGFAEWMRRYVARGRENANDVAPEMVKWFEGSFLPTQPKAFRKEIAQLQKSFEAMRLATPTERALSQVRGLQKAKKPLEQRVREFKGKLKEMSVNFERDHIDSLVPLRKAQEEAKRILALQGLELPHDARPWDAARAFRNNPRSIVDGWWNKAQVDEAGREIGPSYTAIWEQARKDTNLSFEELTVLLAVNRNIQTEMAKGSEKLRSSTHPQELVATIPFEVSKAAFEDLAEKGGHKAVLTFLAQHDNFIQNFNNWLQEFGRFLPQEKLDHLFTVNPGWIRYERYFQDLGRSLKEHYGTPAAHGKPAGGISLQKRFVGAGERINNPVQATYDEFVRRMQMAYEAMVKLHVRNMSQLVPGMGHVATRVGQPLKYERVPEDVSQRYIKKYLEKVGEDLRAQGIDDETLQETLESLHDQMKRIYGDQGMEALEYVIPLNGKKGPREPIEKVVLDNGKIEFWEMSPQILDAIESTRPLHYHQYLQFVGNTNRLFKEGTTVLRPKFVLRELFRNSIWAGFRSRDPISFTKNYLRYMLESASNVLPPSMRMEQRVHAARDLYESLGGMSAALMRGSDDQARAFYRSMDKGYKERLKRVALSPLELVRKLSLTMENAPRAAEIMAWMKKNNIKSIQDIRKEHVIDLMLAGKEAAVDFSQAGRIARHINSFSLFWTAAINSQRNVWQAMKENPQRFWAGIAGLSGASLGLYFQNRKEKWYQDLEREDRIFNWHITKDVKIPIPRELAIMVRAPEMVISQLEGEDDQAIEQLGEAFLENSLPLTKIPNKPIALPSNVISDYLIETISNRDIFSGRPIVPEYGAHGTGAPSRQQFGPHTSQFAIWVGQNLGWSPKRIDHFMTSFFGPLARDLAKSFDRPMFALTEKQFGKKETLDREIPAPVNDESTIWGNALSAFTEKYRGRYHEDLIELRDKLEKEKKTLGTRDREWTNRDDAELAVVRDAIAANFLAWKLRGRVPKEDQEAIEDWIAENSKKALNGELRAGEAKAYLKQAQAWYARRMRELTLEQSR